MDLASAAHLISLTGHHGAGFDVVERDSALQEAGVLQQETKGSVRATNLLRGETATILHVRGRSMDRSSRLTCSWMIPSRSLLAA